MVELAAGVNIEVKPEEIQSKKRRGRRGRRGKSKGNVPPINTESNEVNPVESQSKKRRNRRKRKSKAPKQEENPPQSYYPIPYQPNIPPNLPKEEVSLYKDDAEVTVNGGKGSIRFENWKELNLDKNLLKNILTSNFVWPRKVQEVVIPYILDGYDIKCQSETGTGKTAAYLIPIIDNLIKENDKNGLPTDGPICLIIAPTREIVEQIYQEALKLTKDTPITVATAYGGTSVRKNFDQLSMGCDILCACLGRLISLMDHDHLEGNINMFNLKYIIVDEADQFLAGHEMHDMLHFLKHKGIPSVETRQTLFFSPTLQIKRLMADEYSNPKKRIHISSILDSNQRIKYIVESVPSETLKFQYLIDCLTKIVENHDGKCPRIMIFANRKATADTLATDLIVAGFPAIANHSDYSQNHRDKALLNFKAGNQNSKILVSVNVCGRGIDVYEMDYVINYDISETKEKFIQRCGRTGRTRNGTAISFYVEAKDAKWASGIREVLQNAGEIVPEFLNSQRTMAALESSMGQLGLNSG